MLLCINRADGGVSICVLVKGAKPAEVVEKWKTTADPSWLPVTWREIKQSDVPASRRWRNAWTDAGSGPLTVDEGKAREIRKQELLRIRNTILATLGDEIQDAQDYGDKETEKSKRAKRKKLRSLNIDLSAVRLANLSDHVPEDLR